jgi:hypothetical protein
VQAHNAYGSTEVSEPGNGAVLVRVPDAPINVANDQTTTNADQIGIVWDQGPFNGGYPVIDYRITYEKGDGVYSILADKHQDTSYTLHGVVAGVTYSFRIQARNSEGLSAYSTTTSILAAQVPNTPDMPSTVVVGPNVIIRWTPPSPNGSPINGYVVKIIDHYLGYHTETSHCDGQKAEVWLVAECSVPLAILADSPFDMILGDHIYVKVQALNAYGASMESVPGDGAAMMAPPDAPMSFSNNPAATIATNIGL